MAEGKRTTHSSAFKEEAATLILKGGRNGRQHCEELGIKDKKTQVVSDKILGLDAAVWNQSGLNHTSLPIVFLVRMKDALSNNKRLLKLLE